MNSDMFRNNKITRKKQQIVECFSSFELRSVDSLACITNWQTALSGYFGLKQCSVSAFQLKWKCNRVFCKRIVAAVVVVLPFCVFRWTNLEIHEIVFAFGNLCDEWTLVFGRESQSQVEKRQRHCARNICNQFHDWKRKSLAGCLLLVRRTKVGGEKTIDSTSSNCWHV